MCYYYIICRHNSFFISKDLFESSSLVLVSTYCQLGILTLVRESESTASGASTDDKTATIHVMSLAGNNTLAHYEQSRGYDQISHALSNIHGLYGCSCNLLDVLSIYSLNMGKLPGYFSYKRPGYEAKISLKEYISNIPSPRLSMMLGLAFYIPYM